MSRFHQLLAGKSGSGAGNAPPMVASIPKAGPPDNVSSTAASPPSQYDNREKVFICEPLGDPGVIDVSVLGSTETRRVKHLRSRAVKIAPNSWRNKSHLTSTRKSKAMTVPRRVIPVHDTLGVKNGDNAIRTLNTEF